MCHNFSSVVKCCIAVKAFDQIDFKNHIIFHGRILQYANLCMQNNIATSCQVVCMYTQLRTQ